MARLLTTTITMMNNFILNYILLTLPNYLLAHVCNDNFNNSKQFDEHIACLNKFMEQLLDACRFDLGFISRQQMPETER